MTSLHTVTCTVSRNKQIGFELHCLNIDHFYMTPFMFSLFFVCVTNRSEIDSIFLTHEFLAILLVYFWLINLADGVGFILSLVAVVTGFPPTRE